MATRFFEGELDHDIEEDRAYRIGYEIPDAGVDRLAARIDHPCERSAGRPHPRTVLV